MKSKILIAISDEFLSRIYLDFFREEGFSVLVANRDDEVISLILGETPDVILLDVSFAERDEYKILKELKGNTSTRKIPIILISHYEEEKYRKKAVEFEVKDFLVGEYSSPLLIFRKIRTHLGGERSYCLSVDIESEAVKELAYDLGYQNLKCIKCTGDMEMNLIRDLSKGSNYFKVSFICPVCGI